jgi:hypothetical protein
LDAEAAGEAVVSWHTAPIWKALKPLITDDQSAVKVSALMRTNLHHVLLILSAIRNSGHSDFLTATYLQPRYAHYEFNISDFDPASGSFEFTSREINTANTKKQEERYIRVSFESLDEYAAKDNRKSKKWNSTECDQLLEDAVAYLENDKRKDARAAVLRILEVLADEARSSFRSAG